MSFQFRYQRILDVREMEENREKAEFGRIQQRLIQEKRKLDDLQSRMERMFSDFRERQKETRSVEDFLQTREYAAMLENKIAEQQKVIEKWEEKLEEQRERLIEASQNRQVMENLKERDLEEFKEDMRRQELEENNEIANRQHYRKYLQEQGYR